MLYIHLCNDCNRFHILNGHKSKCPICDATMQEMKLDFMHYVQMNEKERDLVFLIQLVNGVDKITEICGHLSEFVVAFLVGPIKELVSHQILTVVDYNRFSLRLLDHAHEPRVLSCIGLCHARDALALFIGGNLNDF